MINTFLEMGELISKATEELKQSHREMSVTKSLIAEGIVSSPSMLSWIHKGQFKQGFRYILIFKFVISHLPQSRQFYYLNQKLDIEVRWAEEKKEKKKKYTIAHIKCHK